MVKVLSRRRLAAALLGALLALACALPVVAQPETGGTAPPFDLETLDGDRVSLADQRGKIVVLHFGTGW